MGRLPYRQYLVAIIGEIAQLLQLDLVALALVQVRERVLVVLGGDRSGRRQHVLEASVIRAVRRCNQGLVDLWGRHHTTTHPRIVVQLLAVPIVVLVQHLLEVHNALVGVVAINVVSGSSSSASTAIATSCPCAIDCDIISIRLLLLDMTHLLLVILQAVQDIRGSIIIIGRVGLGRAHIHAVLGVYQVTRRRRSIDVVPRYETVDTLAQHLSAIIRTAVAIASSQSNVRAGVSLLEDRILVLSGRGHLLLECTQTVVEQGITCAEGGGNNTMDPLEYYQLCV